MGWNTRLPTTIMPMIGWPLLAVSYNEVSQLSNGIEYLMVVVDAPANWGI